MKNLYAKPCVERLSDKDSRVVRRIVASVRQHLPTAGDFYRIGERSPESEKVFEVKFVFEEVKRPIPAQGREKSALLGSARGLFLRSHKGSYMPPVFRTRCAKIQEICEKRMKT